ncbi:hypothetical protein PFISCL1PPCAC_14953, partial [Pristionchus fissidentatus]
IMSVTIEHNWEGAQWDWPLQHNDGVVKVHNDKDKFEVALDAQHFTPSEIQQRLDHVREKVNDRESARIERVRQRERREIIVSQLPDDVDAGTVKSTLSARGTLLITANKKA